MNDEYVQRKENEICILDGQRNGRPRRISSRRGKEAQGVFAVNTTNRRHDDMRRQPDERRVPETVTDRECTIERGSSLIIGLSLLILAVGAIVMGATFLPIIGYIAGIVLGIAGITFIFAPTRPECGFFLKKDNSTSK